jgi:hypothetical protein
VFGLVDVLDEEIEDLAEVVFSVFAGEGDDVGENYAVGSVCEAGPHSYKFVEAKFYSFGGVFDIGVPDLIGGVSGHFEFIVFDDVDCHQSSVVGVGLIRASGVVHVAFDDVEQFSDEDDSCVSFFPVVFEDSVTEGSEEEVGVGEAVVVDEYFFDHHGGVPDVFFLVGDEAVHVFVDFLDEAFELLRFDGGHVEEDQDVALLLAVFYRV